MPGLALSKKGVISIEVTTETHPLCFSGREPFIDFFFFFKALPFPVQTDQAISLIMIRVLCQNVG